MSSSVAYSGEGRDIPLGFEIRCDDFEVSFYDKSDTPKAYKSRLTVIDNGKEMLTKEIEVNEPLRYKGITFYQSSYGFSPNKSARFIFTVTSLQGDKQDVRIGFGDTFVIPGTNVKAAITDFSPALGIDDKGRLFTYADTMNNPAVFLEFSEGGKLMYQQWILRRYPETWEVKDGIVEFRDLWGAQYTGLQVRKDPGVWIVYAGCFIMAIGLYSAFFMSHRRVWMILRREKEGTKVIIAALSSKNRIAFEEKIDRLLREIEIKKQQMTKG
jgi:cytochrome c biogenesis protein